MKYRKTILIALLIISIFTTMACSKKVDVKDKDISIEI